MTQLDHTAAAAIVTPASAGDDILAEARQRLGDSIRIRFDYVNDIPRTSGGKFRFIASSLSNPTAR